MRVRCDQGLDHGPGVMGWMHPPVHRLLGWVSRPSAFGQRRLVWRLDQLRGLSELEVYVKGPPAETDEPTLERLPTLLNAALLGAGGHPLGTVADAAVLLRTGRIQYYLVARSDPRLPGSSRWRLSPERITDQQPGRVFTALQGLDDLPLARASVRQELLRRSRRWRDQMGEETTRLRDQFQQAGGRFEERLEGWLEEPPWQEPRQGPRQGIDPAMVEEEREPRRERWPADQPDPLEDWPVAEREERQTSAPYRDDDLDETRDAGTASDRPPPRYRGRREDDDPWI